MRTGSLREVNVSSETAVMRMFTLDRIRKLHGEAATKAFRAEVEQFIRENPTDVWVRTWAQNQGTALQTFAWDQDQDFGEGLVVTGAMGAKGASGADCTRGLLNAARLREGGIDLWDLVHGRDCCVVGSWCGYEVLLLHGMGARSVDAVEEVKTFAQWTYRQAGAFGVPSNVTDVSLYDIPSKDLRGAPKYDLLYVPGVLYHCSDTVCALAILRLMLKPGGMLLFESMVDGRTDMFSGYRGPSVVGWNWWMPTGTCYIQMMRDVGFSACQQIDFVDGRGWFVGTAQSGPPPIVRSGSAGFARTDILHIMEENLR